ncbi:MAG TPA: hypothetical protein VKQ08_02690 [Cyclobacteriaceae bacterium]|nr:hypothetical protein [Cyclobacteriaceae bacterium]
MGASKLRFVFILLFILIRSCLTFAQDQFINKEIYLRTGSFRLDSLLANITQQTGVVFSYNARKFDSYRPIHITPGIKDLRVLLEVLKEKGFSIKVMENYVVIAAASKDPMKNKLQQRLASIGKAKELKDPQRQLSVPLPKVIPVAQRMSMRDSIPKPSTKIDSALATERDASADTLMPRSSLLEKKIQKDSVLSVEPHMEVQITTPLTDHAKAKRPTVLMRSIPKFSLKRNLFVKSGVTLDESSFMGVAVQTGLPFAYVTLSVNSNLLATHVRYGVGTSIRLKSWLRLHLVINNGSVSRSGFFTDSLGNRFPIAVKSNLLRFGLGVEFRMKGKFTVQAISNFSQLTTSYFINHAPSDLSFFSNAGDRLFYTIVPPYVMSNTFTPNSDSNVKTWIGVQLNFLYRINFN